MLDGRFNRLSSAVGEDYNVIARTFTKRFRQSRCAQPARTLRQERNALFGEAALLRHQIRMIMAKEIGPKATHEVKNFNQLVATALPEIVAFRPLVHRVQAERMQHPRQLRTAVVRVRGNHIWISSQRNWG